MKNKSLKKPDWPLLAKFLSSQCSVEEQKIITEWMEQDIKNKQTVDLLQVFWEKNKIPAGRSDINRCWRELAEKAGISGELMHEVEDAPAIKTQSRVVGPEVHHRKYRILRYAALLILVISLPLIWIVLNKAPGKTGDSRWLEVLVNTRETKTLTLSDGTALILDSGTLLRYPSEFNGGKREVILNGEAYFEVKADVKRPFHIQAGQGIIRVVGTKFNVRAWKETRKVKVAVLDGKVSLNSKHAGRDAEVFIQGGQVSELHQNGPPAQPFKADVRKELGWMNRELAFENASLSEVISQLERWYGITFVLKQDVSQIDSLTVNIDRRRIEDILEILSAITALSYKFDGKIVVVRLDEDSTRQKK